VAGWELEGWKLMINGYRVSVWEAEIVLKMNGSDGCTIGECT
jgi:hypothetical protein